MVIHQNDVDYAKNAIWQDEKVIATATQRRFGPGMSLITPTTVIATDKRILIVNRATFGMRHDVESIPYSRISSVRMENGFISSSVFLRVSGYSSPGERGFLKSGEQEGEVSGLHKADAKELSDFVERVISGFAQPTEQAIDSYELLDIKGQKSRAGRAPDIGLGGGTGTPQQPPSGAGGGYVYCTKCGSKNQIGANFCAKCGAKLTK
ncbi:MAG: PH domain-containing protein [Candidatus Marsarchaeota archaeon]|nr:PH domain-containing protein [Candidatus Marsarchaeota archaeon]